MVQKPGEAGDNDSVAEMPRHAQTEHSLSGYARAGYARAGYARVPESKQSSVHSNLLCAAIFFTFPDLTYPTFDNAIYLACRTWHFACCRALALEILSARAAQCHVTTSEWFPDHDPNAALWPTCSSPAQPTSVLRQSLLLPPFP